MKLATLCYVRQAGKTLMLHRIKKANDMHAGKWNGLGGKLLPGETPEQCAIREVQEESGLTLIEPVLRGIITFPGFRQVKESSPEGELLTLEDWYCFLFVSNTFTGELIDSPEGQLAWIADEVLFDLPLWEGDRVFMRWLDQDGFFSGSFRYVNGVLQGHEVVFYSPTGVITAANQLAPLAPPNAAAITDSSHSEVKAAPYRYQASEDSYCWMCQGSVIKRHCKIVCQVCGFTRDCSDP
ncbi:MAG: 8-oxo-dGTP diphosphatase [Caldilineaceae bacterium]|nr:8-oxo-dGTP diphosphatase [Caldilineaceae bacterium]